MNVSDIETILTTAVHKKQRAITEADAKKIFQAMGMPVVKEYEVKTPQAAVQAAVKTGFPVVLKASGPGLLHKTEANLVLLDLTCEAQVLAGAQKIAADVKDLEGFLVQPMVRGKREFVAGMFKDPQFGPVIMFGMGGIFTEAFENIVCKVAPLDEADMDDMLASFAGAKLLQAFRGEAACDMQALKAVLKGLCDLALTYPQIREIDINPVIIQPDGAPVAVDGLIILGPPAEKTVSAPRIDVKTLGACFYPESIAFVGASASPGKWGHMLPSNTLSRDYRGKVYLVNPKGGTIMGRQVYTSVEDIPADIDLAVVTIPARHVMDLIPKLGAK
ncbi:MAG: acetate--CoA ligase family protein, partial [Desulfobacteraceae bacterium]|nr:acetate--CoA ligase family protein [Desulfobacteraceae bacterium]